MISKFNNVELLIFSSCELPLDNWRLQRKYYLWGLFRKKKTLPQNQSDGCPSRLYGNIDRTWPSDLSDETGAKDQHLKTG
ncbi:hypothetical protein BVRB_1g011070 [Beta vulgaris subsp. vulgaris]|nr:hypothetical protein BVRB_1g011070 [Beta vulgaris subsp. vulgaris]